MQTLLPSCHVIGGDNDPRTHHHAFEQFPLPRQRRIDGPLWRCGAVGASPFLCAQFGLTNLDAATLVLIRGYASAALGYGVLVWQLAAVPEAEFPLLVASAIFNGAEVAVQGHSIALGAEAGFNGTVWITFLAHTALALWSLGALLPFLPAPPTMANAANKTM